MKLGSQDELKLWLLKDIQDKFKDKFGSYHSSADWANIFRGLVSTLLVGANYNSYAAEVGASLFNITTYLVDEEKGEKLQFVNGGKLEHPFAVSLTAGNEEEKDNVFVEYASHTVDKMNTSNNLTREDFTQNQNGKFLASLFDEKTHDGKCIPRPTKSCRPDFKLHYKGCPLAYGECKTGKYDTKEGLSLTTVLSANILNFATPSTPAVVVHSNDFRFCVQVVTLNTDNSTLLV